VANTGGRGDIQGGSIESSTVDIAQEFTNLIVLQRGYQANSRVITTADTLSQETINLIH
jgi:flagellar hook protein FlgE